MLCSKGFDLCTEQSYYPLLSPVCQAPFWALGTEERTAQGTNSGFQTLAVREHFWSEHFSPEGSLQYYLYLKHYFGS